LATGKQGVAFGNTRPKILSGLRHTRLNGLSLSQKASPAASSDPWRAFLPEEKKIQLFQYDRPYFICFLSLVRGLH